MCTHGFTGAEACDGEESTSSTQRRPAATHATMPRP